MTTTINLTDTSIKYPSADGETMAETYIHLYAILTTLEVLKQYLTGTQATVLANQFLYYAQGFPKLRVAPDVMVIFDVSPGGRDNYKVWEEGQVPQVIFEVTSPATKNQDQKEKKLLYEQLGILEYWLFDPKGEWIKNKLLGYRFYRLDTGNKLLIPTELAEKAENEYQRAEAERERADEAEMKAAILTQRLRELGIEPDNL